MIMSTSGSVCYVITQRQQTDQRRPGEILHDVRRVIAVKLINVVRHGSNHLALVNNDVTSYITRMRESTSEHAYTTPFLLVGSWGVTPSNTTI